MILESVENTPLIFPTIEENGVTITKKYAELSTAKKIQADCDMKASNIILQGLPADIYSLVNHHRVAKDLWERVQLLMQGTSLTKQERECKLYDAFDKFTHIKRESLHKYYLRFTQLINDMNIYNMKMDPFQVNTKFLNNLPPKWSNFYTTDDWAPLVDSSFAVPDFSLGDDLIACLNKAIAFLIVVTSSRFFSTNNQLRTSSNPRNQATIQDGSVIVQQVQGRQGKSYSGTGYKRNATSSGEKNASRQARVVKCYNCQGEGHMARQYEEQLVFLAHPGVLDGQAVQTIILNNAAFQTEDLNTYDSDYDDISNAKAVLMANSSNYGSDVILEETLILEEESRSKMSKKEKDPEAIKQNISHKPIDYEKLNRLSDDFGKRFTPQQELSAEQTFWLRMSNPTNKPSDASPVKIEAPKELPKVSLVNESLKKLKFHLARFDNVVKIRTTHDARTGDLLNEIMEVQTVFNQMDVAVQQSSVDKQCLEIAKK
ncbi:retrovirus-related pol polyprotein from transposon TNT 1-94 [Tanacetum coccineum]|uniref:Retrovirus-related pol polyprotein from transposon TNT 1-94 n=1 Tax=Tanacetum coccineum TaxID=301880 RepID=A0ABQ4YQ04_9ASTR